MIAISASGTWRRSWISPRSRAARGARGGRGAGAGVTGAAPHHTRVRPMLPMTPSIC